MTKNKPLFNLIILIFLTGTALINQAFAEEKTQSPQVVTQKSADSTRIVISTSGPVKFDSYWLDNPYRLVVEFKSRNVIGNIDKEMAVNQGLIKKITASYFRGTKFKAVKTLTFELVQKAPYKIYQEGNNILLDIQASLKTSGFSIGAKETPLEDESNKIIKKLKAMEAALNQPQATQGPSEIFDSKVTNKTLKHVALGQTEQGSAILVESVNVRKNAMGITLWFIGLVSILGLGFAFLRKYVVIRTRNLTERIRELNLQLEKKDAFLEQVEIIRKTIEKTAIEKEEVYKQLKLELREKSRLFEQEAAIRRKKENALQELEKECGQLKETNEALKDILVKRGIARQLTIPEEKGEFWIHGKSPERRNLPRVALTKDFHNTVILKIELTDSLKQIKSFAENISLDGLCFETKSELDEKNPLNLRLFFYGGKVPNFRTQGWIVWERRCDSKNYYGITFEGLSEKVKSGLQHYIETNISRG
ncbi:MAG: PilZ domain-containing protein [Candidatus Omnitrophota bacterium]